MVFSCFFLQIIPLKQNPSSLEYHENIKFDYLIICHGEVLKQDHYMTYVLG